MKSYLRQAFAAGVCLLLVCGCAGAGAPTTTSQATATPGLTAPITTLPSTAAPIVLEDAGVESALAPGDYTSRVFKPTITFSLSPDVQWSRWDDVQEGSFNLRVGPPADQIGRVAILRGPDFVQCLNGAVVAKPNARALADAISGAGVLKADPPQAVTIDGHAGWSIHLPGGGTGLPQDLPLESWLAYGCILSVGPAAFPAEALWIVLGPDIERTVIFIDVDGATISIIGTATGLPNLASDFAATVRFP